MLLKLFFATARKLGVVSLTYRDTDGLLRSVKIPREGKTPKVPMTWAVETPVEEGV